MSALSLFGFLEEVVKKSWMPREAIGVTNQNNGTKSIGVEEFKIEIRRLKVLTHYKLMAMGKKLEERDKKLLQRIDSIQNSLN